MFFGKKVNNPLAQFRARGLPGGIAFCSEFEGRLCRVREQRGLADREGRPKVWPNAEPRGVS